MPTLDFNISEQELSRFKSVIGWLLEREKKPIRDVLDLKISRVKSSRTSIWDKITTNHDRLSKQWLSSSEIYALFYQEDVNGLALLENEQLTVAPSSSYRTEAGGCVSSLLRFFSSLNPCTTTAQKVSVYTRST